MKSIVMIAAACLAAQSYGQCEVLLRENFMYGERPHGGNERLRDVQLEDPLLDYWPQVGSMWIGAEGNGSYWQFALAGQGNPLEVNPEDPEWGTAWGWPDAVAVTPFAAPAGAFRLSIDFVTFGGMLEFGFTSSAVLFQNFEQDGALWMTVNDNGEWTIRANGNGVVASGTASPAGAFNGSYLHVELEFDPATSTVGGRAMNAVLPRVPVVLTRPLSYFGIESKSPVGLMVDNIAITTGTLLSATAPESVMACEGGTVVIEGSHNGQGPAVVGWVFAGESMLVDGPQFDGSVVSGSTTTTLTIENVNPLDVGLYTMQVATGCGVAQSNAVELRVCLGDFDCSGGVDGDDVIAFFGDWDAGLSGADVDGSGGVDGDDVIVFFGAWDTGC